MMADDPTEPRSQGLPLWPEGWYVVARSMDIQKQRIHSVQLANQECVIWRKTDGQLAAINAHCPHMGAHLRWGRVAGDAIRCALHDLTIDTQGCIELSSAQCSQAQTWSVREMCGLVLVHLGQTIKPVPELVSARPFVWQAAKPIHLNNDWRAMVVNGFDMSHLKAVHGRALYEPAHIEMQPNQHIRLSYRSKVLTRGWHDRLIQYLSRDVIRVHQICHGTIISLETDLGATQTAALLGLLPTMTKTGVGVMAYGAFGVTPGRFQKLRLAIAARMFTAFLRHDFQVLQGMRLNVDVAEHEVEMMGQFLRSLRAFGAPHD